MQKDTLLQLYKDQLRDLYSAELQIVKVLPKLAKTVSNSELRLAFEEHVRQTAEQVARLEQIFDRLEEKASGNKSLGMEGLIKESAETLRDTYTEMLMDGAVIAVAQKIEHYEMAGYSSTRALAELLELRDDVAMLEESLREERQADQILSHLAEIVNAHAQESGPGRTQRKQAA